MAHAAYKILIVEDDANERHPVLARVLTDAGYQVSTADCADKAAFLY